MIRVSKTERRDFEGLVRGHLEIDPSAPLVLRLSPSVYVPTTQRYVGVAGGTWTVEIDDPGADAHAVWDAIETFLTEDLPKQFAVAEPVDG